MALIDRIGVDVGRKLKLEDAIEWAARNQVRHIDIQLDTGANKVNMFDDARCRAIVASARANGVKLALHTLSAVNVGEYSPFLSEAVDAYMRAYIEVAPKLAAEWIVVHAGYHFTADVPMRMEAGRDRLQRMVQHAEKHGALLLLENLNVEPPTAEVHYLAHTQEEWRYYYDAIHSPAFALSFTANHAHLMPDGVAAWVAGIPMERVREVRLAAGAGFVVVIAGDLMTGLFESGFDAGLSQPSLRVDPRHLNANLSIDLRLFDGRLAVHLGL
jgi:sugar phosphate isomerase/epimerase